MTNSKDHARLSASAAHRWLTCPGSIRLSEGIEDTASGYAQEGSAAHKLAEDCIALGMDAADFIGDEIEIDGNPFEVDEEMADAVQNYLNAIRSAAPHELQESGKVTLLLEQTLSLASIHPDLGGTCDAAVIENETGKLRIFDYKHGRGVVVKPDDNPQLMIYALGVYLALTEKERGNIRTVQLNIVQPRANCDTLQSYSMPVKDLLDWAKMLKDAVKKVDSADATLIPGEHCRFCKALAKCPAHLDRAVEAANTSTAAMEFPAPEALTDEQIAKALTFAELMGAWVGQVKAYVHDRLSKGGSMPGYKLVAKRANRKWINEDFAGERLQELVGEDAYVRKLLSVAQAEKVLKSAGVDKGELESLWEKPDTGLTVAPESDKRPAVACVPFSEFDDAGDEVLDFLE